MISSNNNVMNKTGFGYNSYTTGTNIPLGMSIGGGNGKRLRTGSISGRLR